MCNLRVSSTLVMNAIFFVLGLVISSSFTEAFLDFKPKIIEESIENEGIIASWLPDEEERHLFCQNVLPDGQYVEVNTEKLALRFGITEAEVITCETDYGDYPQLAYFALGPDDKIYNVRREYDVDIGLYFTPVMDPDDY